MSTEFKTFADWLSISYAASSRIELELMSLLNSLADYEYTQIGVDKHSYRSKEHGSVFITTKDTYVNISMSGGVLSNVRSSASYSTFLQILGSAPYNITRLDIAYDTPYAGYLTLNEIQKIYPKGIAKLAGRERSLQSVLSKNQNNISTGTTYFQNQKYKGTVKLRVYDKAHETFERCGILIPPKTRYELSVARGASLRDFECPDTLFFHFMPTKLLNAPKGLEPWKAKDRINYDEESKITMVDYERLKFIVENHPVLNDIVSQSLSVHGGSDFLKRHISKLLN